MDSEEFEENFWLSPEYNDEDDYTRNELSEEIYPDIIDSSDYGRVDFGGGGSSWSEKDKNLRDPREISLERMRGIMESGYSYHNMTKERKEAAFSIVSNLPSKRMILYNIDILVPAALFLAEYKGVNKKNVKDFLKETGGLQMVNHLDFIRYLRFLS